MIILFVVILIVAALVIFSVQNANPVTVSFILWQFNASLAIVVFLALVAGVIIMAVISLRMRLKKPKKGCVVKEDRVPSGDRTVSTTEKETEAPQR
ncbi:MAG: LapA family protein [Syntrophorhabdales bacterium]|jgi:uncharacterized integral membrane protein